MEEITLGARILARLTAASIPVPAALRTEIEGLSFAFSEFAGYWQSYAMFDRHRNFIVRFRSRAAIAKFSRELHNRLDKIALVGSPAAAQIARAELDGDLRQLDDFVKFVQMTS